MPHGQEHPRHHGPAAGDVDPLFAGILHDQRAQREGERHGESHVAEIQHRRMDHHLGILQQRIQSVAVGRESCPSTSAKRMRGEVHQQQEEHLHRRNDRRRVRHQLRIDFVAQPQHQAVGGEQPRPEQQRAFLPRPQRGELVGDGQVAVAVVQDVGDGEVVAEGRHHQRERPPW